MNNRIKLLRSTLNLTQQEFADRIGIKRSSLANYEMGRNEPIGSVIALICREFHVREDWLRNGDGEMMEELDEDQELVEFMSEVMTQSSDSFKKRLFSVLATLGPEDWASLEKIAEKITKKDTDQ